MGKKEQQLLEGARQQDVALVQKLLHRGKAKLLSSTKQINVNHQDSDGFTALHQAAVVGNVDLVFLLLDAGASAGVSDKKGLNPLHYAAWKGTVELVAALLESGANCNARARNGCTPLHLAAQYGHHKVCKILLQYGADAVARQCDGYMALDLACEFGRSEVVDLLLRITDSCQFIERTHDPDLAGTAGPLHLAVRNGHTSIVRMLLQGGIDINWRTASGTCLHEAVSNQNPEIVQLLIDCGIDVTIPSGLGQSAIEVAGKLPKSPVQADIMRKLSEAQPRVMQVCAINDFQNVLDKNSLAFTRGTVITVLEQGVDGIWRGRIDGNPPQIGTFPASFVQAVRPPGMHGSHDSAIYPQEEKALPSTRSSFKSLPPHSYINLDPRSSQNLAKASFKPNVNNPSYEDVICSRQAQDRLITNRHVTAGRPTSASRVSQDTAIPRSRPSISNPGYEDVLIDSSSPPADTSSINNMSAAGRSSFHNRTQYHRSVIQRQQGNASHITELKSAMNSIKTGETPRKPRDRPVMLASSEPSGVSSELQKALSRRQKIIDDAGEAGQEKERRHSNSRGPPPNPPKRISSISTDDYPERRGDQEQSDQPGEGRLPAWRSSDVTTLKHTPNSDIVALKQISTLSAKKPPPPVRVKPTTKLKPSAVKGPPASIRSPPQVAKKPARAEAVKRFDLSALEDNRRSYPNESLFEDNKRLLPDGSLPGSAGKGYSSDEFEWPAPPPLAAPTPISTAASHFPDPTSSACITDVATTPAERNSPIINDVTKRGPEVSPKTKILPKVSNQPTAPPIPEKLSRRSQRSQVQVTGTPPSYSPSGGLSKNTPPVLLSDNPLTDVPPAEAQQYLDDITSMFDDLAGQFDQFLE